MAKTINITLSTESIDNAVKELERYEKDLDALATLVNNALLDESQRYFDEVKGKDQTPKRGAALSSSVDYGQTKEHERTGTFTAYGKVKHTDYGDFNLLYAMEFGAGAIKGGGSPDAEKMGMGPGTYVPNKGHWNDPHGWRYPTGEVDAEGKPVWKRTYGTPATYPVYQTARHIEKNGTRIAKEEAEKWL